MSKTVEPQKELDVFDDVDVIVVGGGPAGTAAAIASKSNVSPKNIDIKLLQDTLREQGAIVSVGDVSKEALEPYKLIKRINITFKKQDIDEIAVSEREIAKY